MHTPGPLHVKAMRHATAPTYGITDDAGIWVAECHPFNGTPDDMETARANATLYAAAGDLLEALQALGVLPTEGYCFCPRGYTGGKHCGECIDANKAIDKATRPTE